jgi:glycosyltransferase involved in cell wall biosynthesis
MQKFPFKNKLFRVFAPFYPRAFESFDLGEFDTIVSSTTSFAKGVIVPRGAVHVCYINTVSRFVIDEHKYVGGFFGGDQVRVIVRQLAAWDRIAARRPTRFVANSQNVAKRVKQYYGRDADVLPCPVDVERFTVGAGRGDYFAVVSRLLGYKQIQRAIDGCAIAGVPLRIVGTGPFEKKLRKIARGTKTTFHGYLNDAEVNALVGDARAVILPGEEDFGLVPLEAAAAGTPTIALGRGGALETIVPGETGVLFDDPDDEMLADELADAITAFDRSAYDPQRLRAHAETFAPAQFIAKLRAIVEETSSSRVPAAPRSPD